jgi:hypothetical protein
MALQVLFYAHYQTANPSLGDFLKFKEKNR